MAVASVPEFIPRRISSANYPKNVNEPEIVEILHSESPAVGGELLNSSYNDPNVSTDSELAASNVATYQVRLYVDASDCTRLSGMKRILYRIDSRQFLYLALFDFCDFRCHPFTFFTLPHILKNVSIMMMK